MLLLFMADGNQKRQQGQHRAYACYSYPAPGLPATAGEEGPQLTAGEIGCHENSVYPVGCRRAYIENARLVTELDALHADIYQ